MENLLYKLYNLNLADQVLVLLAQNVTIFFLALGLGYGLLKSFKQPVRKITFFEWQISAITILVNTLVTCIGFRVWAIGWIRIDFSLSFRFITDLIFLFMVMDLLMYIFHLLIHRTSLHRYIHVLHHKSVHPAPVDLFVLHPLEALAFGVLWLSVLLLAAFNSYSIILYLALNVIFGVIGHLGFEPLTSSTLLFRYMGTSSFHHNHHVDEKCNFGFYTSIWDRIFGTFKG